MEDIYRKGKCPMTTNEGEPIYNDTDSLTVGENGPILLKDRWLLDKLGNVVRERMPPRVVHAKGTGAYGYFKCTNNMEKYTKAKVFTDTNSPIKVFVRFSLIAEEVGSAESVRDGRGFAVKFYTKEGNYDLVGINFPVFFVKDAKRFPDLLHAFKPSPITNIPDPNTAWDFLATTPESTQLSLYLFSDLGTRKSYIKMTGHSVNTYLWINKEGSKFYIKYHLLPLAGDEWITADEATRIAGENPNVATEELYNTLNSGETADWDMYVQIMNPCEGDRLPYNPLNPTVQWPTCDYPLIKVGKLTLNTSPDNFFEEVEQAAFSPMNLVPGIDFSNDKVLQGRSIAYHDAQRYRIGVNFEKLPVNKPIVKVNNNIRDGKMNFEPHTGFAYSPNLIQDNCPRVQEDKYPVNPIFDCGFEMQRTTINCKYDDFTQAGEFYRSLPCKEQDHLVKNLIAALKPVKKKIVYAYLYHLYKSDDDIFRRVSYGLGMENNLDKILDKENIKNSTGLYT